MFLLRDDAGEVELPGVLVIERAHGVDVVTRGAARVRHARLGNTVMAGLDDAGFELALAAAEAALRAARGEPFEDQGLFEDGTGWV